MRKPRVLYVDPYPTAHSETYISGEAAWLRENGAEIAFWARGPRVAPGPDDERLPGSLAEAIAKFQPDVLHLYAHLRPVAVGAFANDVLFPTGVPVTIRGHSYGFDPEVLPRLKDAARIWLFPQHAATTDQGNVEALPVSYNTKLYFVPDTRDATVVRAGAARAGKGMEEFLRIAALCPSVKFVLVATGADSDYLYALKQKASSNTIVHLHVPADQAAAILRRARICLRGHDVNSHAYGMPISIAEAMGAGIPVVARAAEPNSPSRFGPEDYVGDAGFFYRTEEEAADLVQRIMAWSADERAAAQQRALVQARRYRNDVVLPRMAEVWRSLI